MTETSYQKKGKKASLFHITVWSEFIVTILLVVFLFPGSQSLYAVPDPPQKSTQDAVDKTDMPEASPPPLVLPEKDNDAPKKTDVWETPAPPETPADSAEGEKSDLQSWDGQLPPNTADNSVVPENPPREEAIDATIFRGNPLLGKKAAITFDDGPYEVWTGEYLKVLEEYQVPAAFFLVGNRVEKYPEIARKIAEKGFEFGSHSYRHGRLTKVRREVLEEDFRKTVAALTMSGKVGFFRPPYGDYNQLVIDTAKKYGLKTIGWNVDPRDWETEDSDMIAQRVLANVIDGSVILLHEGRKGTLDALPKIIKGLRDKGYQLVTVSELMR